MDYKECWTRLEEEMEYLTHKDVHQIDPLIILTYMAFIEEVCSPVSRKEVDKL